DSAPDRSQTSLTQSVLEIRGREGFFVKKTIIALAAASSVALSHGVAVADEDTNTNTAASSQQSVAGSSTTGNEAKPGDNATNSEGEQGKDNNKEKPEATGSSKIFDWDENTGIITKFKDIAGAVAAVVGFLGSISALFANIEKIVKQFTK